MKFIFLTFALAVVAESDQSSSEIHAVSWYYNTTFVKVIKTNDIKTRDPIYSTPALILIGKSDGELLQCLQENPNECQVLHKTSSSINSIVITGEYIYAGLFNGVILRCELNKKDSCMPFHACNMAVNALTVGDGYLHAGLQNGTILRCELHQPNSCRPFHTIDDIVLSLIQLDKYIYAGLNNHQMMRCSVGAEDSCVPMYDMDSAVMGFTRIGDSIFAVTYDSQLWDCSRKSEAEVDCDYLPLYPSTKPRDIAQFDGNLYVLNETGSIRICHWANNTSCSYSAHHGPARSIAIVYGTYHLQSRYHNEDNTCTWQSDSKCPPYVTYFDVKARAVLEIHVKDGRLYNSKGFLVDTSDADEGSSGPAAIFAMGLDGRLLLSNSHKKELLHTSSLFAGNPVSGVGEMVVEQGVIKKMSACSEHYQPDLYLNRQVIQSLVFQGYTDNIDSQLCCRGDECAGNHPEPKLVVTERPELEIVETEETYK